jgi:HlyD family secretion protein
MDAKNSIEIKRLEMHQAVAVPIGDRKKRRRGKRWIFVAIALIVVASAVLPFLPGKKPVEITVESAAIRDITQLVSATGKIRPEIEVKISPEVAGEIIEMPVVVGQTVKKGDLLLKIKPDNYAAAVKQAAASLSASEADSLQRKAQKLNDQLDLRRAQDLFSKRLISETDFKAAETKAEIADASYESSLHQIEVARSNLDQAKDLLDKTVIFSPRDGTISVLSSEIGERVVATGSFAGTEVMRVANLGSMEARVDVNENDVVNVKVGDHVRINVDAYSGGALKGIVKRIASTATVKSEGTQQEVTNFEVRIQVLDPPAEIRPGMSASVDIESQTAHQVVTVPIQSVTVRGKSAGETADRLKADRQKQTGVNNADLEKMTKSVLQRVVFEKSGGVARMIPVETGIGDNNYIEIRSGVKAGEEVISGSYTAISKDLKDGARVEIEMPKEPGTEK